MGFSENPGENDALITLIRAVKELIAFALLLVAGCGLFIWSTSSRPEFQKVFTSAGFNQNESRGVSARLKELLHSPTDDVRVNSAIEGAGDQCKDHALPVRQDLLPIPSGRPLETAVIEIHSEIHIERLEIRSTVQRVAQTTSGRLSAIVNREGRERCVQQTTRSDLQLQSFFNEVRRECDTGEIADFIQPTASWDAYRPSVRIPDPKQYVIDAISEVRLYAKSRLPSGVIKLRNVAYEINGLANVSATERDKLTRTLEAEIWNIQERRMK